MTHTRRSDSEIHFERDGMLYRRCRTCNYSAPETDAEWPVYSGAREGQCRFCRNPKEAALALARAIGYLEAEVGRPIHRVLIVGGKR